MKEIDLVDAFNMMRVCDGVLLEGRLVELSLIGIENQPNHEFAYISWSEQIRGEWVDFDIAFKEEDNEVALVDGCYLTLINSDTGEEEEMTLLRQWDAEDFFDSGRSVEELKS